MKRHRKPRFVPSFARPNSDINVTPLVDVVLVLLIIFMVVTPLLDKEITVAVPKVEEVADPQEVPDEQLLVRVDAKNEVTINGKPVALADYEQRMGQLMDIRVDDFKVIFLTADDDANYGFVVQVVDKSRAAGVKTVATATTAPDAAPG
ncbi:MAG TPA: biopolymer transporter ExbD, partial [Myxococcota bacterium]|nr:biopolymer transporter ExbD [Myxococcota bacterium]